jgi:outer membrane lipoprotein carrier protein
MGMKYFLSLLIALVVLENAVAQAPVQNDPKAKTILDTLSKKTRSYKTITAEYTFTITNKDKKQVEKQDGKIRVKGSKFYLEIPGNTIVCDGKTVWNHNVNDGVCTIRDYEPNEEDMMDPTKIFTMYEKGFKYLFEKEEKNAAGQTLQLINLYPTVKPEKKKFHTVKLSIDKAKKQIKTVKLLMKDGATQMFEIKKFTPNLEMADPVFTFDTSKCKEIVDERDGK